MSDPAGAPPWVSKNQGKAAAAFARVQQERSQASPAHKPRASEQVRQSQPKPVLAPKGPVRAAVDRQAHNQAKAKDNHAARQGQNQRDNQQEKARQMADAIKVQQRQNQEKQKYRGGR